MENDPLVEFGVYFTVLMTSTILVFLFLFLDLHRKMLWFFNKTERLRRNSASILAAHLLWDAKQNKNWEYRGGRNECWRYELRYAPDNPPMTFILYKHGNLECTVDGHSTETRLPIKGNQLRRALRKWNPEPEPKQHEMIRQALRSFEVFRK